MSQENSRNDQALQQSIWDSWAPEYDLLNAHEDPRTAISFLQEVSPTGRILELAVGTGRIALPLAAAGLAVTGIDVSPKMLAELESKRGDTPIDIVCGDMADVAVEGPFDLVFVIYSSLFNLTDRARQIDCFRNVAHVLAPGGRFVVETMCIRPDVLAQPKRMSLRGITPTGMQFSATVIDVLTQHIQTQEIWLGTDGIRALPMELRYCSLSELDLMANLADLELTDRFADFERRPYLADSPRHVSVYTKPTHT